MACCVDDFHFIEEMFSNPIGFVQEAHRLQNIPSQAHTFKRNVTRPIASQNPVDRMF